MGEGTTTSHPAPWLEKKDFSNGTQAANEMKCREYKRKWIARLLWFIFSQMAYPSPRKTPRKRRASTSSRTVKRRRTTRGFRVRRVSRLVSARRRRNSKKTSFKNRFIINFPGGKAINVKEDREGFTKTYHRQTVTPQQQKIINKRFKNGYSPFKDFIESKFQLTSDQVIDQAKWIWRTINTLNYIVKMWQAYPSPTMNVGTILTGAGNTYQYGQDQSIYINQFSYRYEIYNPTNYDMNLVIYDIVYKEDTDYSAENSYIDGSDTSNAAVGSYSNPIVLIKDGLDPKNAYYGDGSGSAVAYGAVSDPNQKTITDITTKPTESYPFNIRCKIIKKHTYRLQPGASMIHKFIHKPKCLLNRGYWAYRYGKNLNAAPSGSSSAPVPNITRNIAMKDITSGCLFKVWGSITGTNGVGTDTKHIEVCNLTGKLMIKEQITVKWDAMDQKFTYTFKTDNAPMNFTTEQKSKLEVITKAMVKSAMEVDQNAANNETQGTGASTSNASGNT